MIRPLGRFWISGLVVGIIFGAAAAQAQLHGHGPDAWQVVDVAPDDVLNLRMGPGTQYPIIGSFAPDENGLVQVTCVPFMTYEQGMNLSPASRQHLDLPSRWCLMTSADSHRQGWVSARFLAEDVTPANAGKDSTPDVEAMAVRLVERLYSLHELALRGQALSPLERPRAQDFFFRDDVALVVDHPEGADPLYDAQDFDITDFEVSLISMFRGLISVEVSFRNFGHPQKVGFALRADTQQQGAPIRIMEITHRDWSFPR
ncbi:MAG: SH3 domain-containing protein [Roseinatronobacter monicus]